MSYTSSAPYTASTTFPSLVNGDLDFTSIVATESDYGSFTPFINSSQPAPAAVYNPITGLRGIEWGGFKAGATGANSSVTFTISYNVNVTNSADAITSLQQLYVVDDETGPGVSATATEQAYDSSGNLVANTPVTWSAANGSSAAVTLAAGYQQLHIVITVTESIGSTGSATSAIDLSTVEQNFGQTAVSQLGAIESSIFCDVNDTGVLGAGDIGMAGVTVELLNSTGTQVLETTTTNASGGYSFDNLLAGTYETQVIAPGGDQITTPNGGLDTGIVLTAGGTDSVAATGLYMPAVFDVHVYFDANDNGVQDSGDNNLAGVTVALLNGNGTPTGETATTDANGNVSFTGLLPGSYEVSVTSPPGDTVTQDTNVMAPITLASCGTANAIEGVWGAPDVSIVKSVTSVGGVAGDPSATYAGEVIDYNVVVTNTGNETLTDVVVTDTTLGTTLGTLASLAVGASVTYSTWQTVTQAEINSGAAVTNTATVTDDQTPSESSTVSTGVTQTPEVSIVKSVTSVGGTAGDPLATYAGEVIDYNVVVTNTGNETLTDVVVTDSTLGTTLGTLGSLAVGASVTYSTSQTVTQAEINSGAAVTNTATVTDDQTPSESSTVSTGVTQTPEVSIVKSVTSVGGTAGDPSATYAGEVVDYSVVVTNTGNETLTDVVVTDTTLGTTLGTFTSLAVGASVTYTTSQTITQAEIDSGAAVTNTATVTDDQTPSESSTVSTGVTQTPEVSIVKSVTSVGGTAGDPSATYAGEVIDYNVVATNTGNETLTDVVVTDTTLGTTLGTLASLAVGASVTYSTSQTITQAEIDSGAAVTNTATVTDSQNVTGSSTATTGVTQTPGVSIVKSVTSVGGTAGDPSATYAGEGIDYNVVVTNTGNETLSDVVVTDSTLGTTLGTLASLAVGASVTYSTSQTITQAEINSGAAVTNTATVTDSQNVTGSSTATTAVSETGGITGSSSGLTVIKLPSHVVVGTCGQVTYTFDVINTGSAALTNVQITDNIGTAANPDYITPILQTQTTNGVLLPGQTWVYTATINESGDFTSKGGSQSCAVSGQNLGSGCTAWLNSSFTPTSCKNGATYTFQNITCTIKGPDCGTITVDVPNACVTFSSFCTQATTIYDASENCWVTTLPANCNPGNVFLSGIPCEIPSGCNLSGATVSWNIGESGNNCGASSISWQTGCTGYSDFDANGCNALSDYNQIGVKACDNLSGYGNGGSTTQGYGWNSGGSGWYCGGDAGYDWNGSSNDCAGTPENQYTGTNCCGGNSRNDCGSGTCGNGGGTGTVSCSQLGDSSQADTVTVTATTLSSGFSLGDAASYGVIAFAPNSFKGASGSPINGNVGVGASGGTASFKLGSDQITGNLVTTGTPPSAASTGGTVTGSITGHSTTLTADIAALQALSLTLASETGTSETLTSGMTINATSGTLDSAGDYVFTITRWANDITINGTGANNVVLNFASGVTPMLDNVTLTGGLTANQVLFNDQNTGTIGGTAGDTFNGTVLAPNAVFSVTGVTIDGHLYGGASGQTFSFTSGATLNAPANTSTGTPTVSTVTASDSTEVQVLSSNSPISENGTAPTGSLSSLYGTAEKIEFAYDPSNTVSLKQIQAGLASVTGSNSNSMAFLEISNNSNPYASGASIYFEGEVQSGEDIFADATINQLTNTPIAAPNNHFSTVAGADIHAYVFTSQAAFESGAAPIQTMTYNTSGSQAMHIGDQIASLTVVGYVGTNGGHLLS